MSTHNLTFANSVYQGAAYYARFNTGTRSKRGLPVEFPIYHDFGAVVVADADGLVESVDPANNATLTLRATVTGMTNTGGVVTLDTPRNVTLASGVDDTAKSITVTGTDVYGAALVEAITGPNNGTSSGKKAFKTISSIVATGNFGTITVGFGDVLGLPYRIADKNQIVVRFDGAADAATVVAAVDTTATATTGDVRGTIDIAGTLNGTKTLAAILFNVNRTTKELAFGVAQYGG